MLARRISVLIMVTLAYALIFKLSPIILGLLCDNEPVKLSFTTLYNLSACLCLLEVPPRQDPHQLRTSQREFCAHGRGIPYQESWSASLLRALLLLPEVQLSLINRSAVHVNCILIKHDAKKRLLLNHSPVSSHVRSLLQPLCPISDTSPDPNPNPNPIPNPNPTEK